MKKQSKAKDLKKLLEEVEELSSNQLYDKRLKLLTFSRFIYTSSVVEGVKINRGEVTQIVKSGLKSSILKHSPNNDLWQAYGQKLTLNQIEKWATWDSIIRTHYLQGIHKITFQRIDPNAGSYRNLPVILRKSKVITTIPVAIHADMADFNRWLIKEQRQISPEDIEQIISLISRTYHTITRIHPFIDGNGRSARLFINLILRKYKLPYIVIPKVENFEKMRRELQKADAGDLNPLTLFMEDLLSQSLKKGLKYWQKKNGLLKI